MISTTDEFENIKWPARNLLDNINSLPQEEKKLVEKSKNLRGKPIWKKLRLLQAFL